MPKLMNLSKGPLRYEIVIANQAISLIKESNQTLEVFMLHTGSNRKIKCLVWDLDHTLWNGVLLEDPNITLIEGVMEVIKQLDSRGILQSISSKNDYRLAMDKLRQFGLSEYFLFPQINWNSKSSSINEIAKAINIGLDAIAFIDDQEFERDEVRFVHPEVLCINASNLGDLLQMPEMNPRFITDESKFRRLMYLADLERNKIEESFIGPKEEFLASLDMKFTIGPVRDDDLQRAEELTVRTHQLNSTGYSYSYEDLSELRKSHNHQLFIAELEDKYGTYGKIGLMLVESNEDYWVLKLLLTSCRVMSRGVGSIMLNHIMMLAQRKGVRLLAEFVPNDRNRIMYVSYKFAGFKEIGERNGVSLLEHDLKDFHMNPEYVKVNIRER
jgi:FkbH-like protein